MLNKSKLKALCIFLVSASAACGGDGGSGVEELDFAALLSLETPLEECPLNALEPLIPREAAPLEITLASFTDGAEGSPEIPGRSVKDIYGVERTGPLRLVLWTSSESGGANEIELRQVSDDGQKISFYSGFFGCYRCYHYRAELITAASGKCREHLSPDCNPFKEMTAFRLFEDGDCPSTRNITLR